MPGDELGEGIDHDVRTVFEGAEQVRGCHGVVDHEGDSRIMGDTGNGLEVIHVVFRVSHRFGVNQPGVFIQRRANVFRIGSVDELHSYAHFGQRVVEQVIGSSVEIIGGNDILPALRDIEDRIADCRLTGGNRQRTDTAVQLRHPLFQHIGCGVHDPRIDVSRLFQGKEACRMVRVPEAVGTGLVNGHGTGKGR